MAPRANPAVQKHPLLLKESMQAMQENIVSLHLINPNKGPVKTE